MAHQAAPTPHPGNPSSPLKRKAHADLLPPANTTTETELTATAMGLFNPLSVANLLARGLKRESYGDLAHATNAHTECKK